MSPTHTPSAILGTVYEHEYIYSLKEPFFEKPTLWNDYTNDKNHFQHD